MAIKILFVIACKPKPVEKLSIETPKENINMFNRLKFVIFSFFFRISINITKDKYIRIIPNKKLLLMENKLIIFRPIKFPIKGIKKCIIPTTKENNIILLVDKL